MNVLRLTAFPVCPDPRLLSACMWLSLRVQARRCPWIKGWTQDKAQKTRGDRKVLRSGWVPRTFKCVDMATKMAARHAASWERK